MAGQDSRKPQQEGGGSGAGAGQLVPCRPVKGWTHVLLRAGEEVSPTLDSECPSKLEGSFGQAALVRAKAVP